MTSRYLRHKWWLFFIVSVHLVTAQNKKIDSLLSKLENSSSESQTSLLNLELSKAFERIEIAKSKSYAIEASKSEIDSIKSDAYNQVGKSFFYQNKLDSAQVYFQKSIALYKLLDKQSRASVVGISLGAVQLRKGEYKNAIATMVGGAKFFEENGDSLNMAKCYINIASAFGELDDSKKAIEYGNKADVIFTLQKLLPFQVLNNQNMAGEYSKMGDTLAAKKKFIEAEKQALKLNDKFSLARIYNNLGNLFLESDYQQSEKYLTQSLNLRKETKNNDGIAILYNNLGYLDLKKGNYKSAIGNLKKAVDFGRGTNLSTTYNNLSDAYQNIGNYQLALDYSNKKTNLNDSILKLESQKAIAEISTKYETEKKEKEILNLQNAKLQSDINQRKNKILLYTVLALLFLGTILAFAFVKNARKKTIIAEQRQELESQKVEKLLKDQELVGIDAMLEGQEKERQRIAEDLHDSLGGKLSALKLFVEDIKKSDETLYKKIKMALDESYDEVRNISHQKNASAMIEKGLIPAVNIVANRLKSTKRLNVEVINIDLKQKIKNFTELQLFRIIQELLANTIKHAEAKNVSIQFSEENDVLNVVYEDDGLGFKPNNTSFGVGLRNIENRVKKIDGSYNMDSNPGDGTSVILNIPL